jgi:hypothetical protein
VEQVVAQDIQREQETHQAQIRHKGLMVGQVMLVSQVADLLVGVVVLDKLEMLLLAHRLIYLVLVETEAHLLFLEPL